MDFCSGLVEMCWDLCVVTKFEWDRLYRTKVHCHEITCVMAVWTFLIHVIHTGYVLSAVKMVVILVHMLLLYNCNTQ